MEWTKETVIQAVEEYRIKHGRLPRPKEYTKANNLPSHAVIKYVLGLTTSELHKTYFNEYYRMCDSSVYGNHSVDYWLNDFRSQYLALGCSDNKQYDKLRRKDSPCTRHLIKIAGLKRWGELLQKCNIRPNTYHHIPWTKESIIQAAEEYRIKHGRLPQPKEHTKANNLPSHAVFNYVFRMTVSEFYRTYFNEYCHSYDPPVNAHRSSSKKWTKENMIQAVERYRLKHGKLPKTRDLTNANQLPSSTTFKCVLGMTVTEFYETYFNEYQHLCNSFTYGHYPVEYWLDDFKTQYFDYGCPYQRQYDKLRRKGSPCSDHLIKIAEVSNWAELLQKCGVNPSLARLRIKWTKETIIQAVEEYRIEHGKLPKACDFGSVNKLPSRAAIKCILKLTVSEFYKAYFNEFYRSDNSSIYGHHSAEYWLNDFKSQYLSLNCPNQKRYDKARKEGAPSGSYLIKIAKVKTWNELLSKCEINPKTSHLTVKEIALSADSIYTLNSKLDELLS